MDISNPLPVIAEVSIALAGFSGLIVALRKNPGPLTPVQKYRLPVLLALSFGTLFLSFFPEWLRAAQQFCRMLFVQVARDAQE